MGCNVFPYGELHALLCSILNYFRKQNRYVPCKQYAVTPHSWIYMNENAVFTFWAILNITIISRNVKIFASKKTFTDFFCDKDKQSHTQNNKHKQENKKKWNAEGYPEYILSTCWAVNFFLLNNFSQLEFVKFWVWLPFKLSKLSYASQLCHSLIIFLQNLGCIIIEFCNNLSFVKIWVSSQLMFCYFPHFPKSDVQYF